MGHCLCFLPLFLQDDVSHDGDKFLKVDIYPLMFPALEEIDLTICEDTTFCRDTSLNIHRDNVINLYEDIVLSTYLSIKDIFLDHIRKKLPIYYIRLMQDV